MSHCSLRILLRSPGEGGVNPGHARNLFFLVLVTLVTEMSARYRFYFPSGFLIIASITFTRKSRKKEKI
jgi:hypothetical protein